MVMVNGEKLKRQLEEMQDVDLITYSSQETNKNFRDV